MSLAEKIHEGLKKHQAKHSKKDASDKEVNPSGKVDHFVVHPMVGGHMVETHMKHKSMEMKEPHKSMHKSLASVHKHMKAMCGETQEGAENETPGKQTQEEYKEDD